MLVIVCGSCCVGSDSCLAGDYTDDGLENVDEFGEPQNINRSGLKS